MVTWLYIFVALSVLGLILSILAHIGSLLGLNIPEAVFGLHLGLFVVWIPAVFVSYSLGKNHAPKNAWKMALRGAPLWMRYMLYGFLGYAVFNFVFLNPLNSGSVAEGTPPSVMRLFSSGWMLFYSASMVILYSKTQIQKKDTVRKCPNGHEVACPAQNCEKCGEPIRDLDEVR